MVKVIETRKPGIWETEYGNTAILRHPAASTAYDLDAGIRIPVSMLSKFIRPANYDDLVR